MFTRLLKHPPPSPLTFRTTSPSWMLPSLAARLSGEMSLTKMWLARRRPYSAYRLNDNNKDDVSTRVHAAAAHGPPRAVKQLLPLGFTALIKED